MPLRLRSPVTPRAHPLGVARSRLLSACSPTLSRPGGGTAHHLPGRVCLPLPLRLASWRHRQQRRNDWQRPAASLESP